MKPLLIKVDKDGNLKIDIDELQKMLDASYHAGYHDGQRDAASWYQPISVPTITTPNWYDDRTKYEKYEITCSQTNGSDNLAFNSMAKQRDE